MLDDTVEEVMEERFPTVGPNATVEEAVGTLAQSGWAELVVEEENVLRGMVRARDLLRLDELDVDPGDPFFLLTMLFDRPSDEIERHVQVLTQGHVRGVMRTDAPRLAPDDPVLRAVHLLAGGAEVLPVVDDEGHVLGVVTRDSVIRHVVRRHAELRAAGAPSAEGSAGAPKPVPKARAGAAAAAPEAGKKGGTVRAAPMAARRGARAGAKAGRARKGRA